MSVDFLSGTLRALSFLTLFQAAGIALFFALCERKLPNTQVALRRVGSGAALIAGAFLIAQYLLEAGRMSGELGGVIDPTMQGIVMRSAASVTLSWRLLGLLLIAGGLRRRGAGGTVTGLVGVVVLLAAFTLVGHTSTAPLRWLLSPVLLAHLFVVTFWFGALLPLYLISSREPAETAGRVVATFSARAVWLVPGLLLAGLVLATLLLPNLAALRTPYGALLIAKVIGFSLIMPLAALNRWRFGPALGRGDLVAGRRFRSAVVMEFALLATILCVTAVMTTFYSPES
ncbi:MAG TPA: CopD family protein [Steroidobacteraceae bacterium]